MFNQEQFVIRESTKTTHELYLNHRTGNSVDNKWIIIKYDVQYRRVHHNKPWRQLLWSERGRRDQVGNDVVSTRVHV
ncbi:hypothetical protein J6590_086292 [Homalodisca vitripennis]|nr:hypothetical protein J6590_086292 [Homalodisca vitripennis]